mgnify:CR=1 FL=1
MGSTQRSICPGCNSWSDNPCSFCGHDRNKEEGDRHGKEKKGNGKAQPELPGAERPTNSELDEKIGAMLALDAKLARARDKRTDARALVLEAMREVREKLERDDHGNPTYVYRDGEQEIAVKLSSAEKLVTEVLLAGDAASAPEAEAQEEF